MWAHDLRREAVAGLFARPVRMALTVLGTVIGVAALVATLGLSRTASHQIIARFDELAATEITVSSTPAPEGAPAHDLPWDAPARIARLNGVVAAGTLSEVDVGDGLVAATRIRDPQRRTELKLPVQAASPSLFPAIRAKLRTGRVPDEGHSTRVERVAVLGPNAAAQLGIVEVGTLPAIAIGDEVFLVVGIMDSVQRKHALLSAVIPP